MTQEELNELASDCRLAFGHQAGAYNDGVDVMLRAVSIAQAQAAAPTMQDTIDALRSQVEYLDKIVEDQAQAAVEPVTHQFQARDGTWHGFTDQKHYDNTVADGTWPIRALFTSQPDHAGLLRDALSNLNDLADMKNAEIALAKAIINALKEDLKQRTTDLMLSQEAMRLALGKFNEIILLSSNSTSTIGEMASVARSAIAALEGLVK